MKKKICAVVAAVTMTLSAGANVLAFSDMPSNEGEQGIINRAVEHGLLSGYEDGTVRPYDKIKRSEMAAIITGALKATEEGDLSGFGDVHESDWFYSVMAKAYKMGAFSGDGENMNPNNYITFQECFTVLSNVFDLLPKYTKVNDTPEVMPENTILSGSRLYDIGNIAGYPDFSEVADWAKVFVSGLVESGAYSGIDGKLLPNEHITRLQFADVMDKLISAYIDEAGEYSELPEGNVMIRCDGVTLDGVNAKGNVYVGDSVAAGSLILKGVNFEKKIVIRGCKTYGEKENGNLTFGDKGIVLDGYFQDIRIIRPYINADLTSAKFVGLYTVKDTNVAVSFLEQ